MPDRSSAVTAAPPRTCGTENMELIRCQRRLDRKHQQIVCADGRWFYPAPHHWERGSAGTMASAWQPAAQLKGPFAGRVRVRATHAARRPNDGRDLLRTRFVDGMARPVEYGRAEMGARVVPP